MTSHDSLPITPTHRRLWRAVAGTLWIAGAMSKARNLKHLDQYHVRIGQGLVLLGGACLIASGLRAVPVAKKSC